MARNRDNPTADGNAAPIEPRYASVMPWVLILLAIALAAYGGYIRTRVTTSSRVTERTRATTTTRACHSHARASTGRSARGRLTGCATKSPTRPAAGTLVPDKQTTTVSAPSDALLGVLLGAAAVLALAGAFYARVTKINLPGGAGIELAALSSDLDKIQNTVPQQVQEQIDQLPEQQKQALHPGDIARISSVASIGAQRELLQVRAAARGEPVSTGITLPMADVTRAQSGMPLSDELIGRLVHKAVGDAVRTSAPASPAPKN